MQFSNSQTKIKIQKEYGEKSSSSVSIFCGLDLEQNEELVTFSAPERTLQRQSQILSSFKEKVPRSCHLFKQKVSIYAKQKKNKHGIVHGKLIRQTAQSEMQKKEWTENETTRQRGKLDTWRTDTVESRETNKQTNKKTNKEEEQMEHLPSSWRPPWRRMSSLSRTTEGKPLPQRMQSSFFLQSVCIVSTCDMHSFSHCLAWVGLQYFTSNFQVHIFLLNFVLIVSKSILSS